MDDTQYNSIKEDLLEIKTHIREINGRVRRLEVWRGITIGMGVVLSIIIIPVLLLLVEKSL